MEAAAVEAAAVGATVEAPAVGAAVGATVEAAAEAAAVEADGDGRGEAWLWRWDLVHQMWTVEGRREDQSPTEDALVTHVTPD
ncbi:hypothetical protein R6Q59_021551 [Mikania micrantha]